MLSYHIIPSGSFLSSELENCQQLLTRLKDTPPLTARVSITTAKVFAASGGSQQQKALRLSFEGATNSARVLKPDIEAGSSVVHIIDDVLLPRGVGKGAVLQYYPSFESVLTGAKLKTMMAALQVRVQPGTVKAVPCRVIGCCRCCLHLDGSFQVGCLGHG